MYHGKVDEREQKLLDDWLAEHGLEHFAPVLASGFPRESRAILDEMLNWRDLKMKEHADKQLKHWEENPPVPGSTEETAYRMLKDTGVPYTGAIGGGNGTHVLMAPDRPHVFFYTYAFAKNEVLVFDEDGASRTITREELKADLRTPEVIELSSYPTSIGSFLRVRHCSVEEPLDLTDYDSW